jgi:hypothetical protein
MAESAYRDEFAKTCPSVLDEETYAAGMAAATAAWAVVRLVRLPKLLAGDLDATLRRQATTHLGMPSFGQIAGRNPAATTASALSTDRRSR